MDEIAIVRKRTRVWPIVMAILLLLLAALAVWWFMGGTTQTDFGWNQVIEEITGRDVSGIA
jgi:hypothetical protein